jgi:hypothetical protein
MPTQDMNNAILIKEISANASGLFPAVWSMKFFCPDRKHGTIGGKNKNWPTLFAFGYLGNYFK